MMRKQGPGCYTDKPAGLCEADRRIEAAWRRVAARGMARIVLKSAVFSGIFIMLLMAASAGARAAEPSLVEDLTRLSAMPGFKTRPLMTLVLDDRIADDGKRQILGFLSNRLELQLNNGMCPRGRCGRLPAAAEAMAGFEVSGDEPLCLEESSPDGGCTPNPVHEQALEGLRAADPHLAAMIEEGIGIILRKIADGRVPSCLLPGKCLGDDAEACRNALRLGWWLDFSQARGGREVWLHTGGFIHLLLGEAFTCSPGLQTGWTCAIYSAAALMSHYCVTPLRNPEAGSECVQPPGVSCVGAQEFLRRAADPGTGCWTSRVCRPGQSCEPVVDTLSPEAQARLRAQISELGCGRTSSPSARCANLQQRLRPARPSSGLSCLEKVYKHFGFGTALYPPNEAGWERVRRSLNPQDPHPVQVHINPETWALYGGNGSDHAVVLEGLWTYRGVERVLLRDSNTPYITVRPVAGADGVRQTFFDRGGGGVGLCLPGDTRRCPD